MKSSESIEKIAKAIAVVQGKCRGIQKSGENKFHKYKYAELGDYVDPIKPILAENGLSLIGTVAGENRLENRNNGKDQAVEVSVTLRLLHESGEWIEIEVNGEGQDPSDKSIYKAITGARKYGIALFFNIATTDDPENYDARAEEAQKPQYSQQKPTQRVEAPKQEAPKAEAPKQEASKAEAPKQEAAAPKKEEAPQQEAPVLVGHSSDPVSEESEDSDERCDANCSEWVELRELFKTISCKGPSACYGIVKAILKRDDSVMLKTPHDVTKSEARVCSKEVKRLIDAKVDVACFLKF